MIPSDLVAEAAAVSLVLFVGLVLCFPLVLAMIGTVEGREARPLEAAVTWMRRHRARHRRGRSIKAQWDIQLAHAGGRYEELPTLIRPGDDSPEYFRQLNAEDVPRPGQDAEGDTSPSITGPGYLITEDAPGCLIESTTPRSSIFDRLSDTDCFAAINWDIHRAVNELAVLQRDLWAGYKLPPWKKWKR